MMNAASLHRRSAAKVHQWFIAARHKSWRVVAALRCRPTDRTDRRNWNESAIRRVSLAAGSAPMVYRRGTKTGGLSLRDERNVARPPYLRAKRSKGYQASMTAG